MRKEQVKYDCSYFEGHIPCKPNKQYDVQCNNCSFYELDTTKIINLQDKNSHLKEIYKICNFQEKTLKNYADINTKKTKVLFIEPQILARIYFIILSSYDLSEEEHDRY